MLMNRLKTELKNLTQMHGLNNIQSPVNKPIKFMVFLIAFILIILIAHTYVFWHIWSILPLSPLWKTIIISLCVLSFSCLFLYLSPVQDKMPMAVARIIYTLGTSWIIVLLYLVIAFLLLDIGRLCHIVPNTITHHSIPGSVGMILVLFAVLFCGNIRYYHKQCKTFDLSSSKVHRPAKLLFVSDLHLGYHNPRSEFHRWVELMNAEHPDIILIGGDIIDGNIHPLTEEATWEEFKNLEAPIYACLGNHEYIAGRKESEEFYEKSGIHLLTDSSSVFQDFCIIGRDDRSNRNRKSVKSLLSRANRSKYTILLDHQPYNLQESSDAHIDLQLSGHTHHGQVWPINWITDAIYECAYGRYSKSGTEFYISSGMGIWGGKFRIGTCSEYIVININ